MVKAVAEVLIMLPEAVGHSFSPYRPTLSL